MTMPRAPLLALLLLSGCSTSPYEWSAPDCLRVTLRGGECEVRVFYQPREGPVY